LHSMEICVCPILMPIVQVSFQGHLCCDKLCDQGLPRI
jgi:hypothetical protein